MVLDQMGYFQVFVGNEIARFHQRTRSLSCEVFTLPTHFEIAFCQAFDGLLAVLAALLFPVLAPMEAFELLFCLAQIPGISNHGCISSRCRRTSIPHQCPPVCRW